MSKRQHKKKQGTPAASTQFASLMQTYCPENVILSEDSILLLINDGAKSAWMDLFAATFGTSSTQEHRKQFVLERDMLTEELASVEATIGNLEKDIHQVEKDIAQLGQETWQPYQSCEGGDDLHNIHHEHLQKECLLSAFSSLLDENCMWLEDMSAELNKSTDVPKPGDTTYFQRADLPAESGVLLESLCTRSLRLVCQTLSGVQDNNSKVAENRVEMQEAFSKLKSVLGSFPPEEILSGLMECAVQGEERLKHHTMSVDLSKEGDELSCVYSGKHWKDLSQSESAVDILKHHIQKLHLSNAQSGVALDRSLQRGQQLKGEVEKLKLQAKNRLLAKYGSHGEAIQVASSVLTMEIEEVGQTAAGEYLKTKYQELTDQMQEQKSVIVSLKKKEMKVKEFTRLSESKQSSIEELVKHNAHLSHQIQRQQKEMAQYRRQHICTSELSITTLANSLKNYPLQELKLFLVINLSKLCYQFSPPKGHRTLISGIVAIDQWCAASGDEQLLPCICTMLRQANGLQAELNHCNGLISAAVFRGTDAMELLNRVDVVKSEEVQLIVSVARDLQNARKLLHSCDDIINGIHDWWTCPAQNTVPWVTREGMNFQEWKKQWTLLASKLRTLQASSAVSD